MSDYFQSDFLGPSLNEMTSINGKVFLGNVKVFFNSFIRNEIHLCIYSSRPSKRWPKMNISSSGLESYTILAIFIGLVAHLSNIYLNSSTLIKFEDFSNNPNPKGPTTRGPEIALLCRNQRDINHENPVRVSGAQRFQTQSQFP